MNIEKNGINQHKYLKINENSLLLEELYGDGNCFFRAISSFLQVHKNITFFRKIAYEYIQSNTNDIII